MHFVAKSAEFTKEVYKNESVLSKFAKKAKEKFKGIGSVLKKAFNVKALIGTALGAGGIGAMVHRTVEYSSALVEASRVAGIGITQFEKLREVLAGDGMALEEATSATRRFSKRIGEMRLLDRGTFFSGIEGVMEKFPDLGMELYKTVKDKSKTPIDVLQNMVDLSVKAKLGAEEIAALFDLGLGLQGRKMGITLVNAAKEFGDLEKSMDHYAQHLTMTAEEHVKNKELGQQFTFTGRNIKDAVRKIMSNMSEPLTEMIEKFNDWLLELKKSPEAAQGMIDAFTDIKDAILIIAETVKAIHGWWNKDPKIIPDLDDAGRPVQNGRADTPQTPGPPRRVLPETPPAPETPKAPQVDPLEGLDGAAMSGMSVKQKYQPVTEQIINDMKASSMVAGIGSAMAAPMPKWLADPGGMQAGIAMPMPAAESKPAAATTYPTGWGTSGTSGTSTSSVSDLLQPFADLRPSVEELNQSFQSMIHSFIEGESNFKDTLRGLLDAIMQRSLVEPAADWLSKGTDAFFGSLFTARADGGMARGLTLVGERGPELVDFNKPGMVYSNERLSAALGGGSRGSTVINYNISSTDGPGVRAALAAATPSIVEAAQARVGEEADRPGGFRRAIRGGI